MWVIVNQFSADVFRESRIDEAEESVTVGRITKGSVTEENVIVRRIPEERVIKENVTVGKNTKGSITEENVTVGRIPEESVIEERHYL